MRFKGLDLNLLVALDVLIEERSVSRAAERLHISQPAMSAALGRLRSYFNDPILGAHGKRMIPTAHALQLRPMLRELLGGVDAMIAAATLFDPATSARRYRIGASDYLATILFGRLVPMLEREAPHVSFEIVHPSDVLLIQLEQGDLDLIIAPGGNLSSDHPHELLFEEHHVVAGWRENVLVAQGMTEDEFFAAGHVVVEIGRLKPTSFSEFHLRAMGRARRIEILVSSFLLAPEMLVATKRLTVMHEKLARTFAERLPIAFVPMPFAFPVMREMIQYHSTRRADPGLLWLIARMRNAMSYPKTL